MQICSRCGARNITGSAFCVRCGASFVAADRDLAAITDGLASQPELSPEALVNQAAAQLAEGNVEAAIANCRRALALDPRQIEAHALLAMAYEQRGELEAALEAYEAVLALDPERPVERQKAALLRLRLGIEPPPVPSSRRLPLNWRLPLASLKNLVATNPPLAAGIGAGLFVLLVGSLLLIGAQRARARAERQAQYERELQLARQAFANQQYAEATQHYQAAWALQPGDPAVRREWEQAYQEAQAAAAREARERELAALPKYVPNTTGRNPFEPVPIGPSQPPAQTSPKTAAPSNAWQPPAAVPPPTWSNPPRTYESWQGAARPTMPPPRPSPTQTPPSSRRETPSADNKVFTPPPAKSTEKPATPAAQDTSGSAPRGEITIWVSSPPARGARANTEGTANQAANDAAALRAQGEQAAREGRTADAISQLQRAEAAYRELARQDPANAAAYHQAAETCRTRVEILRQNNNP